MFSIFKRKPRGPEIWDYPDLDALCRSGAAFVRGMAGLAVKQRGVFRLCISAAPAVLALCRMLPQGTRQNEIAWEALHLFLAWENLSDDCSPLALEQIRDGLLPSLPLPGANLHPIPLAKGVENAVALYEQELERHFQTSVSSGPPPWDLLLLDVGPDGRLGAIAPADPALDMPTRWVAALARGGVGMPLHALEGASNALLLATGDEMGALLQRARAPDEEFRTLPAGCFSPSGRRVWLTDAGE